MTWDGIETAVQPPENHDLKRLRIAVARALEEEPLLENFLWEYLKAGSYSSGREYHQVAFSEGQRALARQILQLGGRFDD